VCFGTLKEESRHWIATVQREEETEHAALKEETEQLYSGTWFGVKMKASNERKGNCECFVRETTT
jgi:hypothetical protein